MKARILLIVTLSITCLAVLAGCMQPAASSANSTDPQVLNRQYMTQVNSIMGTMADNLEGFEEAVAGGEVLSLDSKAKAVDDAVAKLKAITPPDAMKDIHEKYVAGTEEMQAAFSGLLALYKDVKAPASGSADLSGYADKLKEVQEHYDAGIAALKEADEAASNA